MFNCFDHGGAGGGFENTWGNGKLMFSAFRTKMVRIHNFLARSRTAFAA